MISEQLPMSPTPVWTAAERKLFAALEAALKDDYKSMADRWNDLVRDVCIC